MWVCIPIHLFTRFKDMSKHNGGWIITNSESVGSELMRLYSSQRHCQLRPSVHHRIQRWPFKSGESHCPLCHCARGLLRAAPEERGDWAIPTDLLGACLCQTPGSASQVTGKDLVLVLALSPSTCETLGKSHIPLLSSSACLINRDNTACLLIFQGL